MLLPSLVATVAWGASAGHRGPSVSQHDGMAHRWIDASGVARQGASSPKSMAHASEVRMLQLSTRRARAGRSAPITTHTATRSVARPSRPGPADAAPGLAAAVGHGRAAPTHAPTKNHPKFPIFFKPIPPTPTNTTPHPQKIITTPQNPKKIIQNFQFFSTPPRRLMST